MYWLESFDGSSGVPSAGVAEDERLIGSVAALLEQLAERGLHTERGEVALDALMHRDVVHDNTRAEAGRATR
jgi:hypothetical protein